MTAKHRITVNLDDDEYGALLRMAEQTDRSLAWLGRRAICDLLEQHEKDTAPPHAEYLDRKNTARQSTQ